MADVALLEVADGVATVTLNRPEARNALSTELIRTLARLVGEADGRDDVDVLILTGADPAFCAGLDLKELGNDGGPLKRAPKDGVSAGATPSATAQTGRKGATLPTSKPIIGAVNGVAVTGGLELALNCDFLVASERARFADTHARVGVHPLWGLTVLLPQAVGIRRAREMSATGNFVDAETALAWGLVNHVVAHERAPAHGPAARRRHRLERPARRAGHPRPPTRRRAASPEARPGTSRPAPRRAFQRGGVDPDEIERRRRGVVDRGRSQV